MPKEEFTPTKIYYNDIEEGEILSFKGTGNIIFKGNIASHATIELDGYTSIQFPKEMKPDISIIVNGKLLAFSEQSSTIEESSNTPPALPSIHKVGKAMLFGQHASAACEPQTDGIMALRDHMKNSNNDQTANSSFTV